MSASLPVPDPVPDPVHEPLPDPAPDSGLEPVPAPAAGLAQGPGSGHESAPIPRGGPIAIIGPLSISDLLDRTFRAMRARFGMLILSAAVVLIPIGLLSALISGRFMTGYMDMLQNTVLNPDTAALQAEQYLGNFAGYFGSIFIVSMVGVLGSTLVLLMCIHHIQRLLHGEGSTLRSSWQAAISRLLPMIGMQILQYLIIGALTVVVFIAMGIVLVVVALVFGGLIASIGSETAGVILGIGLVVVVLVGYLISILLVLAPAIFLSARWIAGGPSVMIEQLRPRAAMRRSWDLTKGRVWRSILYMALLFIFAFIVIGIPVSMVQWVTMIAAPTRLMLVTIVTTLVSYVLNLFVQPFYATAIVLYYYDLRVRAEAYDVALRVAALEAELAPNAPPA